jgi:ankyrin repeat protein
MAEMKNIEHSIWLRQIQNGRTDIVFDCVEDGMPATYRDADDVSLLQWCAYYGDVAAMRQLLSRGESLDSLGANFDLNGAAFHGHWQLVQFLIECGANANWSLPQTSESPLHVALCGPDDSSAELVVKVLLANGANPNCVTVAGATTGCLMRDARTRAETPLHRAAAFGTVTSIRSLIDAGASVDVKDMHGDTPLSWASWHRRADSILQLLLYGEFTIHPQRRPLRESLQGEPLT